MRHTRILGILAISTAGENIDNDTSVSKLLLGIANNYLREGLEDADASIITNSRLSQVAVLFVAMKLPATNSQIEYI